MTRNSSELETLRVGDNTPSRPRPFVIGFTILFHPNVSRVGDVAPLVDISSAESFKLSRLEPTFRTPAGHATEPLNSLFVSRTPIQFHSEKNGGVTIKRASSTELTVDGEAADLTVRISPKHLQRGVVLVVGDSIVLLLHLFDPNVIPLPGDLGMIGENPKMVNLRTEIRKVADTDTLVLIRGESGTGKELVAAAIQSQSGRANKPFEKVNITEIPATIAERELFGAAKHAGTGEPGHDGYFIRAHTGTLFLDEIGDIEPAVQPKLLRAIETGEIQVLGAKQKNKVDVRIIAGTDANLELAVQTGQFKSSLLQRLTSYTIVIPSLRDRRDDIGRLFLHFLRNKLQTLGEEDKLADPGPSYTPWLPASFMAKLALYDWPGNVRQLKNVAARVAILNRDCKDFQHDSELESMLDGGSIPPPQTANGTTQGRKLGRESLATLNDKEIIDSLQKNGFNISQTVRDLQVERALFYRDLKRRGIDVDALRQKWTSRKQ